MKRFFVSLMATALFAGVVLAFPATSVFADSKTEVCKGVTTVAGGSCADGTSDINRIISVFLNIFSVVIGIVAVVMIMVGGFKYITAGGDSSKVTSAKHTIIYALIGIIVVAMAQFLVQFVLQKTQPPKATTTTTTTT
ncbi:MAG TPA: pilin [Candidatus Saccharimonadales bacterium]|nr:pilin [Candidatus Saccharimonadales bacterium]